jgi:hypothetical protein
MLRIKNHGSNARELVAFAPFKQYPALRLRLLSGFASKEGGGLHHTHDQDRVENKIFLAQGDYPSYDASQSLLRINRLCADERIREFGVGQQRFIRQGSQERDQSVDFRLR